jgi:hypothetical protein
MSPDTPRQPGLPLRVAIEHRRISSQHRQLDEIYSLVVAALNGHELPAARLAFQRFRDAWEAHTSLEDDFYFPALHGMRPELAPRLDALADEHAGFRRDLDALERHFARDDRAAIGAALDAFITTITDHERREEALAAELSVRPKSS